ncbi:MAG TPA: hypothetical protein VGL91_23065 [Acidobacteriota bacterium]|jgi:flagellar biosynthesis/type III secretory pathway protein FliH
MRLITRKEIFATAVLALLFGVFALAHDDRGNGSKDSVYRMGYNDGHRDGLRHGEEDSNRGIGYDPNSSELKHAGQDVHVSHKGDYKKGYREGYQIGYREGYDRRGGSVFGRNSDRYPSPDRDRGSSRYPYPDRNRGYGQGYGQAYNVGFDQGYRDGQEKGQSDYSKNRAPDLRRHDWYNDADRGYHSNYGNKRDYQAGYRTGFEQGYDEVYRGRGGYRRNTGSIWDGIFRRNP